MSVFFPKAFAPPAARPHRSGAYPGTYPFDAPVLVLDRGRDGEADVAGRDDAARMAALRETVRRLERGGFDALPSSVSPLGVAAIDAVLHEGGLATGALHEILPAVGDGRDSPHDGAALAFASLCLGRFARAEDGTRRQTVPGRILWCRRAGGVFDARPYAPALAPFLDPARLILVETARADDVLWAMEEGLRCGALTAVLGEVFDTDLVATRRLQLAAEKSGVPALLLRRRGAPAATSSGVTAATTRWRVASAPSAPVRDRQGRLVEALGSPRWRLELLRNRFGDPSRADIPSWTVEWNDETGDLAVVSAPVDRSQGPPVERLVG